MNSIVDPAELVREASLAAYEPENPLGRVEAIFSTFAATLTESANLLMPEWAPFTFLTGKRPIAIHGYEFDEELEILTLFSVLDCHSNSDLTQTWSRELCPAAEVERKFADMEEAINLAKRDALPALDESDPANRLYAYLCRFAKSDPSHISLCIWTTGELSKDGWRRSASSAYRTDAWDAQRLATAADSGDETLEIDFSNYGGGLHLLMDDDDYSDGGARGGAVLIGKIPGECLADLYFSHRTRLLQRNVRAFLKTSGAVNGGILQTARTAPERFLSYNNGIATTSSKVQLVKEVSGVYRLTKASDFQIVNGGQTTATLMVAKMDRDADISAVEVALKLTIVDPEDLDELVPKISRYANSQNKVQDSDFESNNPWLVKLEKISRSVEATKDSKSEGQRIKWYFERFRGQFNVDLGTQKTPAQKKAFKATNPPRTRFSKTDLAVVAIAWDQEPHVAALGPQKCFGQFAKRLHAARALHAEGVLCEPSEEDFRRLCAIMILRREAMVLCKEMKAELSPLISNAVRSLYAIARISHDTKSKLPWSLIWHDQELPAEIHKALRICIKGCDSIIVTEAKKGNKLPSEFAKKGDCWSLITAASIDTQLAPSRSGWDKFSIVDTVRPSHMVEADTVFFGFGTDDWDKISETLSKLTDNAAYPGCAKTMSSYAKSRRKPTDRQARILAKGLLLLKSKSKCPDLLGRIDTTHWQLLTDIAGAARPC